MCIRDRYFFVAVSTSASTAGRIIGFVGGGGIGYYLSEQINSMIGYHKAGTAIWAIIVIVWVLDFLSAEVRKRIA